MRTNGRSISTLLVALPLFALAACSDDAGTTPPKPTTTTTGRGAGGSGGSTTGATGGSTTGTGTTTSGGTGGATGGSGGSGGSGASGGSGGTSGGSGGSGGSGTQDAGTDGGGKDAGGGSTFDIGIGPITLAPGEERTVCVDKKLPTDRPMDIVRMTSDVTKGGHHLVFYKSSALFETTAPVPCQTFRDVLVGTVPLYIAQKQNTVLDFPTGVAYTMPANQMVRVELHFVNTTTQPLPVTGTMHLTEAKEGTITEHANLMFYGNVGIILPPQAMATVGPTFHAIPAGRKIFGLTGHQHRLGTSFTIELSSSVTDTGKELYKNMTWDDPPLTMFTPPLVPTAGQGLRFTCNYNNTTNGIVTFGEGADQEMCFLWAYYYPDQGFDIGF